MKGIDYSQGTPAVADLHAANIGFACRYVGWSDLAQTKILTGHEAFTLTRNNVALVSNYEWYNTRPQEGAAAGQQDAARATTIHTICGGPSDAPIYFSVDYDSPGYDVAAYFKAVAGAIGIKRVGAYGGYRLIKYLFDNGLITYGWQTYAWSGGQWDARAQIRQTKNAVMLGSVEVDYDESTTTNFGQWHAPFWYDYPITVEFGNPNYDSALGGAHNMDCGSPPNYPVTALLPGTITSLTKPDWGWQVGKKLDMPYNGVLYDSHQHLSAINPSLKVGTHVNVGDVIGWTGGANTQAQYVNSANPTGGNFTNSSGSSSRVQAGYALMNGPEYGIGAGWVNWPLPPNAIPHYYSPLNPTAIILAARSQGSQTTVQTYTVQSADFNMWYTVTGAGTNNEEWHSKIGGFVVHGAIQDYYALLSLNGNSLPVVGLPRSNEMDLSVLLGFTYVMQCYERAVIIFDPTLKRDNAPPHMRCYLLHIEDALFLENYPGVDTGGVPAAALDAIKANIALLVSDVTALNTGMATVGASADAALQTFTDIQAQVNALLTTSGGTT